MRKKRKSNLKKFRFPVQIVSCPQIITGDDGNLYYLYKTYKKDNPEIFYKGMHCTNNILDGYSGSGKIIKLSIKKYGGDDFLKEIIAFYPNANELKQAEKIFITLEDLLNPNCYNIAEGGSGYMMAGLADEEKKEIYQRVSQSNKDFWNNLSPEEKEQRCQVQRDFWDGLSDEEKEERCQVQREIWNNLSPEEKEDKAHNHSISMLSWWLQASEEILKKRNDKLSNSQKNRIANLSPEKLASHLQNLAESNPKGKRYYIDPKTNKKKACYPGDKSKHQLPDGLELIGPSENERNKKRKSKEEVAEVLRSLSVGRKYCKNIETGDRVAYYPNHSDPEKSKIPEGCEPFKEKPEPDKNRSEGKKGFKRWTDPETKIVSYYYPDDPTKTQLIDGKIVRMPKKKQIKKRKPPQQ